MSANTVTLATCALNQWALDFDGNLARILQSALHHHPRDSNVVTVAIIALLLIHLFAFF